MIPTELNDQLLKVREAIAEQERLSRLLEQAERSLAAERGQLQDLAAALHKESEDVRRLEGASLSAWFYQILGSKENRLDKEQQEMLAANLKYENCRRRVSGLEQDVADLQARLSSLGSSGDLRFRYNRLLTEKERLLIAEDSPAARRLNDLDGELGKLRSSKRELDEAVQAGQQAQSGLDQAVEALESASGLGTLDVLGGGLIVDMMKHSRLDEANEAVQRVQPLLQRFERELADVGGAAGLSVDTGGLTSFADMFMDGLLFDLLMQSKINDSLKAAQMMDRKVRDLLSHLQQQQAQAAQQVQDLETERQRLLEQG